MSTMRELAQRGLAAESLPPAREPSVAPDAGSPLSAALRSLYRDAAALLHDHLHLAALEARQAVRNLVAIIAFGIIAAFLAVTGWLSLAAALVGWAVAAGTSWPLAFLCAAIISIGIAVGAAFWIKHLSAQLMFALTLRWLRPSEPHPRAERGPMPRESQG